MTEPPDDRFPYGPAHLPPEGASGWPGPQPQGYPGGVPYWYPPPTGQQPPHPQDPYPQYPLYPPGGYPPGYPYPSPTPPTRRVSAPMVILGFFIGSAGWLVLFLPTAAALGWLFDSGSMPSIVVANLIWMAVGIALLIFPRTRQAGAGVLLGSAIGLILWAGLCAALLQ